MFNRLCVVELLGEEAIVLPPIFSGKIPQNEDGTLDFDSAESSGDKLDFTFENEAVTG